MSIRTAGGSTDRGLGWLLRPYRGALGWTAALSLVSGLAEASVLVLIVNAAVSLSNQGNGVSAFTVGPLRLSHVAMGLLLALAFGLTIVRLVAQLGATWITSVLVAELQRRLRNTTFEGYLDATWAVQAVEREGNLQQLLGVEVPRSSEAVMSFAIGLTAACNLIMLAVSAFVISPVAAGAMLGLVVALFFVLRPLTRRARKMSIARSGEESSVAESLDELVRTAEEIRVHGVGDAEKSRLCSQTERVARWVRRIQFVGLAVSQVYQGTALLLLVLALFVVHESGASNLASLGVVVLVLLRSFAYSQQLQTSYHQILTNAPSIARVHAQQSLYREHQAKWGQSRLQQIDSLALEGVTYSYHSAHCALNGVSFAVGRGEVIGVIGPSGAGKSTLVQVLLRLRVPDDGRYLINGTSADDIRAGEWASLVSYVPQDPKVVAGSVADNIRFFRQNFTDEQVEAAARLANLHADIAAWPAGYETKIGQRADAISGGQRQRLCIARALLSSPQLLILDEPTSALDVVSEQVIQRTLEGLRGRTTTIIIAHRLSTLSLCDRILVLSDGRVEAMDTPEKLTRGGGFYQRVVEILGSVQTQA